jgi:hypothetical protein
MQRCERPRRRIAFSSQIKNRKQTAQQNGKPEDDERRSQHDNVLSRHDYFADRPERYSSKLQMRPSERDAHYSDSEEYGCEDMSQC